MSHEKRSQEQLDAARGKMLRRHIQGRGVRSDDVLSAMERVPREEFVAEELRRDAYSDAALPIDCDQTISQPYIVALMTDALELQREHRVLEIGTGSGYQTAVLAELVDEVISIERHSFLSRQAGERLARLGYKNITLQHGDGNAGAPSLAPFDRIIITAAAEQCPPALLAQLSEGGLLIGPFGPRTSQRLERLRKQPTGIQTDHLCECRFVPLLGP